MEENLRNNLKKYKGNTIFVTHNINEAYRVCDDIKIFNNKSTDGFNMEIINIIENPFDCII